MDIKETDELEMARLLFDKYCYKSSDNEMVLGINDFDYLFEELVKNLTIPFVSKSYSAEGENKMKFDIRYGKVNGYPPCCILEFLENAPYSHDDIRYNLSENRGFYPCMEHAKMIEKGWVKLEDLIEQRTSIRDFPYGECKGSEQKPNNMVARWEMVIPKN